MTEGFRLRPITTALVLLATLVVLASPAAAVGNVVFKEGNGGSQSTVCSIPSVGQRVHFKSDPYGCDNDEARSMILPSGLPAGFVIHVMDDPECRPIDDYTRYTIRQTLSQNVTIGSFEGGTPPSSISVLWAQLNGLDGKVSCVIFSRCGDGLCTSPIEACGNCSDCCSGGGSGGGSGGDDGPLEELTVGGPNQ